MRRQLVASGAAITTALAVALALPAFADHEIPTEVQGNPTCAGPQESLDLGESLEKIEFQGDQPTEFAVDPADYPGFMITAVIVKGGNSAFVYDEPPFDHLTAPEGKEISHVEVCGVKEDDEDNGDKDNGDKDNGDKDEDETAKPTTPAPVPTEVPAGASDGSGGSPALLGFALVGTAAVAGAVVVARRRFLHDS